MTAIAPLPSERQKHLDPQKPSTHDNFKRRVLSALDRSLDVPDTEASSSAGEAMWW